MRINRIGVFETNSSSTHSITIDNKNNYDCKLPIKVNPLWSYGFGWQYEYWDSIEEKIAYMVRCLVSDTYTDKELYEKIKLIQNKLHNLGIDFELPEKEEWKYGYVDHENWYSSEIQEIYDDEDTLLCFLLNNNSYIEGGNDDDGD